MQSIQLTRRAIRDLKHLSEQTGLLRVPDLLTDLQQGLRRYDTCRLEGVNNGLKRVKYDRLRLIFQDKSVGKVVKAVRLRDDRTYTHNYNSLSVLPCYEWHGEHGGDWLRFVTDSYRYSPVLSEDQTREVGLTYEYKPQSKISLIQSPPGTGKTLAALLRACEYHQMGWDIAFIVPSSLIPEIKKFKAYQSLDSTRKNLFFLGTLWDWLSKLYSEQQFATSEEELAAFRQVFRSVRDQKTSQKDWNINYQDVILYQAFVLDQSVMNRDKNPIYQNNVDRIRWLEQCVNSDKWHSALGHKLSRWQAAQKIQTDQLQQLTDDRFLERNILIIIDEAQDYLLAELEALFHLGNTWADTNHQVQFWLFGDLNQRIQPVNFTWSNLKQVKRHEPHWQNFRNSRQILEFANPLLDKIPMNAGVRWEMPRPSSPDLASEEGDPVRLIVYNSKSEAEAFLERLQQTLNSEQTTSDRSLLQSLSRQVKVLVSDASDSKSEAMECLTVEQVKGREFEASIAFCIFGSEPPFCREQIYRWYTLLTRTRSRLLVIATPPEIATLGENFFAHCQRIEPQNAEAIDCAIQWVTSVRNDADAAARGGDIKQQILDGCVAQPLHLYWDMYDALRAAEFNHEHLATFEQEMIEFLRLQPIADRERELTAATTTEISTISVQCLLLRSMDRSWDAVHTACQLMGVNDLEYQRLVNAIATDLKQKGLPYEAARVCRQAGFTDSLCASTYPYPELLNRSGPLLSVLSQEWCDRLSGLLDAV